MYPLPSYGRASMGGNTLNEVFFVLKEQRPTISSFSPAALPGVFCRTPGAPRRASTTFPENLLQLRYVLGYTGTATIVSVTPDLLRELRLSGESFSKGML